MKWIASSDCFRSKLLCKNSHDVSLPSDENQGVSCSIHASMKVRDLPLKNLDLAFLIHDNIGSNQA
jgi:hypothetical protein